MSQHVGHRHSDEVHQAMTRKDYKSGWGVVDADGVNVRTISVTRIAAIVNWLVVERQQRISNWHTDVQIETIWNAERGEAVAMQVRIYVQHGEP